jgi:hypothetical protein
MENVVDRLRFLSATRCDISAELEFIASNFDDFMSDPDAFKEPSFSLLYEIIGHGSLELDNEDDLWDFISNGIETKPSMFCLLEFVRLEKCSGDVMNDYSDLLSGRFYGINTSM